MNITRNKLSFQVTEGTPNEQFWKNETWETETYETFDKFITKDKIYLDIGAWIGPTVLYGAQLAKKVITFEPDPVAWTELQSNIALNPFTNIDAYQIAFADHTGTLKMGSDNRLGESVTRVGNFKDELSFETECILFDEFMSKLGDDVKDINFVKVDIEGAEYLIAQSQYLKNHTPPVLLSIHPEMMPDFNKNIEEIISLRSYYLACVFVSGSKTGQQVTDNDLRTMNEYYTILLT
jgi:FkbM family methyltransferase